jgi:hypothetical protein
MKTTDNAARKHPIAAVRKLHAISEQIEDVASELETEFPALSKRLDVALDRVEDVRDAFISL